MYPFRFLEKASEETKQAISYLEEQRTGYGDKFVTALGQAIDMVRKRPDLFPFAIRGSDIRRVSVMKPFHKSFSVFYKFDGTTVWILAVFNNRRNPEVWKSRTI